MREEFLFARAICACIWDHPRACGKNYEMMRKRCAELGSPPRMREEYHTFGLLPKIDRITPAHAGRIMISMVTAAWRTDHPRACGKNPLGAVATVTGDGITPAHAGRILML